MELLPLLEPYFPNKVLAWGEASPITYSSFLSDVGTLSDELPEKRHAINLCENRYWFLVGFAAALSRGHTTLLPQSRAPLTLEHLHKQFSSSYRLTDISNPRHDMPTYSIPLIVNQSTHAPRNPLIPGKHIALIAFTSGSTGQPRPCPKTWQSLISIAQKTAENLHLEKMDQLSIVATVPPQHMYGLETSIMLPIQQGWAIHPGHPFFPEDVRSALRNTCGRRILITTPFHLRACLLDKTQLPDLECIISATAPLPFTLAQEAEKVFNTKVLEIYGFAEAGTLATRRPVAEDTWELLEGLTIESPGDHHLLHSPYLPEPVHFPDDITPKGTRSFLLHGRTNDFLKVGGHRISLAELNAHLMRIENVKDGAFFLPEPNIQNPVARLVAFAVTQEKSASDILKELRQKMDPVFLPRPLYVVSQLPRNAAGKLPRIELLKLLKEQEKKSGNC
jgi:acyl-coenzyme A synthetase/AMP-(fatty) acid ligase